MGDGGIDWPTPTKAKLRVRFNGVPRSKTVKVAHRDHGGRGEAEAALAAFKAELAAEATAPVVDSLQIRTLGSVVAAYVDVSRQSTSPSTIESYENVAKRIPLDLNHKDILDITAHDLDMFFAGLQSDGYAAATVKHTRAIIRAALEQAVRWGWSPTNVATATRPIKGDARDQRVATPAEVFKMASIAAAPVEAGGMGNLVLAMFILMAAITGCRRGEICGLRWEDIDNEAGTIRIERQLVPRKGGQQIAPPKSRTGTRTMTLDHDVLALLSWFWDQQRALLEREPDGWLLSYDAGITALRGKDTPIVSTRDVEWADGGQSR